MPDRCCDFCGTADPRWLRHVDQDIGDYLTRTITGFPGRNSSTVAYCDTDECKAAAEAQIGPQGNRAALHRLTDELGQKGLDADSNEVRATALAVELLPSPSSREDGGDA